MTNLTGISEHIKKRRCDIGLTPSEVATRIKMSLSSYLDLETHDDDFRSSISVGQIIALSELFDEPTLGLIGEKASQPTIGLSQLPSYIQSHIVSEKISVESLGDKVGYNLGKEFPMISQISKWNFDCLDSVCGEIAIAGVEFTR